MFEHFVKELKQVSEEFLAHWLLMENVDVGTLDYEEIQYNVSWKTSKYPRECYIEL